MWYVQAYHMIMFFGHVVRFRDHVVYFFKTKDNTI